MSAQDDSPRELVEQAAVRLHESVARLAAQLCPFPAFLGMTSVQAIELEPPAGITGRNADLGCVVVLPDGEICELELEVIPGPMGPADVDQIERYRELELPPEEYVLFASAALYAIYRELRRRG
jgi:hypothetical protein